MTDLISGHRLAASLLGASLLLVLSAGCRDQAAIDFRSVPREDAFSAEPIKSDAPSPLHEIGTDWAGPMLVGHDIEVPIGMPFFVFRERHPEAPCFVVGPDLGCEFISPSPDLCPVLTTCANVLVKFKDGFLASYTATYRNAAEWGDLRRRFVEDGSYQLAIIPDVAGTGALAWKWRRGSYHLAFFQFMDARGDSSHLIAPYGFGFGDEEFAPNAAHVAPDEFTEVPRTGTRGSATLRPDVSPSEGPVSVADKLRDLEKTAPSAN